MMDDDDDPAIRKWQRGMIASFLREGGYANLLDAMRKLGVDLEGLEHVIQHYSMKKDGLLDQ